MKFVIIALATAISATAAFSAELPTDAKVPTGVDVAGETFYRILPNGSTERVANPNDLKELFKDGANTQSYPNVFGPSGGGDGQ